MTEREFDRWYYAEYVKPNAAKMAARRERSRRYRERKKLTDPFYWRRWPSNQKTV